MSRESAEARLHRLRQRLTITFALVAFAGIAGLALITTVADGRLRANRFDTELQGRAFRSAALVFFDDVAGEWNIAGVEDDVVVELSDGVAVVDRAGGSVLFASADIRDADALIAAAFADAAEEGSLGTVLVDGRRLPAAAAPYFDEESASAGVEAGADDIAGAVVVAAEHIPDPDRRRLVIFVWSAAALFTAVSAGFVWLIAGRVVRPLAEELDREEAFLATAAHELRTPLGRFRAVTESALMTTRSLPDSPERAHLSADLRRLLQLNAESTRSVEDLLLLGRIEAGVLSARREPIRLDQLVAGFEATTPELAVDTTEEVVVVGDPTLMHHAISNLVVNAQQHGRRSERALTIEAEVRTDGDEAVVLISDNGPGLGADPDSLFTRHRSSRITGGLGLWIVRSIVNDLGGTVVGRNRSDSEGGAVFELRLPGGTRDD